MAFFHSHIAVVQRSKGQSSVASAAYRNGQRLTMDGHRYDYRHKGDEEVAHQGMFFPSGETPITLGALWRMAEHSENRKDAAVARTIEFAFPSAIDDTAKQAIAIEFCRRLASRYGVAGDWAIHDKDGKNPHAHIGFTTRPFKTGALKGKKISALDGPTGGRKEVVWMRKQLEMMTNKTLELAGSSERVDMRSYADQGIAKKPGKHRGPGSANDLVAKAQKAEKVAKLAQGQAIKAIKKARESKLTKSRQLVQNRAATFSR